jgi:uncharacterized tellurite resistance protein B-like protein
MEDSTRIQICSLVAGILFADREIGEEEAAFLQRMRSRFQLPRGTAIEPTVDRDAAIAELRGLPAELRDQTLDLLVGAATADGTVTDTERVFLTGAAKALAIDESALEERLERALADRKPQPFGLAAKQEDDL